MILIDMPMPANCLDCPACNEYLMCAIHVTGRGWGENDVREFSKSRPEWCPLKEQEEREKAICKGICEFIRGSCSTDTYEDKEYVCHVIQQTFIKGSR